MHAYALLALLVGYVAAAGVVGWRLLRTYSHKDERNNVANTTVKLFIIMGYIHCMGLIILLPAVAQIDSFPKVKDHFNSTQMCRIMYAILGSYIFIITPCLAVVYSQRGEVSNTDQCANRLNKRISTRWRSYFSNMCTHTTSTICKNVLLIWILSISLSCCLFFLTYLCFQKISLSLNADGCASWYPYLEETNRKKLLSLNLRNHESCKNVGEDNIRIDFNVNFNDYVVMCVSLMGSIGFAVYGGVGLVSLPLGLLYSAVSRYRGGVANRVVEVKNAVLTNRVDERREALFKQELTRINRKAENFLQITQEVELKREEIGKSNYFKSLFQNIQHRREKRILNYMVHRLQLDYERSVHRYNNPTSAASSIGPLLLGFFFLLASVTIFFHICLCILGGPTGQGKLLRWWPFHWDSSQEVRRERGSFQHAFLYGKLFSMLLSLHPRKNSLSFSLLVIYPLVMSYLLVCAFFGFSYICHKLKLGLLLALERKSTYLDTILLNTCLLMFMSSGAALISLRLFPAYAKQTYAFTFFDLALKNLSCIGVLYARNGLLFLILLTSVLTVLLFFVPKKSGLFSVFMPATFRKILNQQEKEESGVDSDMELDGQLDVDIESNPTLRTAGKVPTRNKNLFK
ncbi:hypothetical protein PCYB_113910 [Plasmodium cynomolgi strain B]|uniref:LMBR1 domain-containing protein n=1 Tax=Plasmodium cynomolgi (strain B) TaxID=1120755 RepID=K6UDX7_PLACD|nr:hypothetical protein PCYB_113910 [Plasmodium cynomolgi strain B]GAB67371.1 hypothetical protein PCYB_113910 [Plasmodium cynomolgi strain B]